jgi:hypothetical protein
MLVGVGVGSGAMIVVTSETTKDLQASGSFQLTAVHEYNCELPLAWSYCLLPFEKLNFRPAQCFVSNFT